MLEQLQWLRDTVTQLLQQAGKPKSNPRLYAEVVLDNVPGFMTDEQLLERLNNPNWLTQLQSLDARVGQHVDWFTRFRDHAIKMLARKIRKAAEERQPVEAPLPGHNQPMSEGDDLE